MVLLVENARAQWAELSIDGSQPLTLSSRSLGEVGERSRPVG